MNPPYIIGITGGSASGKTTFIKRLCQDFGPESLCLVSQDNYYRHREEQPMDFNGIENYDTPDSLDLESFANDINQLIAGQAVSRREYTFNNPLFTAQMIHLQPAPVVVVEGIFVFWIKELQPLLNLRVFIDAKEHIKLKRRIHRDLVERNYGLEDVLYRYEHHVSTAYEKYILPFKDEVDLVVPNNHGFESALEVLKILIQHKIKG